MSMPTLDLVVELEWTGIKTKKKIKNYCNLFET